MTVLSCWDSLWVTEFLSGGGATMSDLFGRFPGWLVLIWGRPCVRRCVVRPADVCCGVAGRRDASGAFASCRSINSRPLFSSFSDHLPASPPALLCPFAGPSPNFSRVFSALLQLPSSPRPGPLESLSRPFPGPFQALFRPFPDPSKPSSNPAGHKKRGRTVGATSSS